MSGLKDCYDAFERIKKGKHLKVIYNGGEITRAMVSKEAGKDKGYLKKNRPIHEDINRKISEENESRPKVEVGGLMGLKGRITKLNKSLSMSRERENLAIGQQILLANRVRELEEYGIDLEKRLGIDKSKILPKSIFKIND